MVKRKVPEEEREESSDESEMEVNDEAKAEPDNQGEQTEEEDPELRPNLGGESIPFLDTFYGISSSDPRHRAQAARDMIQYCLMGPEVNTSDAVYAFRRLLNGLCSGRAAARQGNASALASFLKTSFQNNVLRDIQREAPIEGEQNMSHHVYVRRRLIAATDPSSVPGKKKGSEDRDYRFGRLFGILSVVRSGVLLLSAGECDAVLESVVCDYANDLAQLYLHKRWMREPAAHAIGSLLNSFYALCPDNIVAVGVVNRVVSDIIVPRLLLKGDLADSNDHPLFATFSAEQIAIGVNIQTFSHSHTKQLPSPLDSPILSRETLQLVAVALSDTSHVAQPRTHLVWDALCSYISEAVKEDTQANVQVRVLREHCPLGDDSVRDLLDAVVCHVIMERLLGLNPTGLNETNESSKMTHERGALALSLMRNFAGVEFVSSITGRTTLKLDHEMIEHVVFKPALVKVLFVNILGADTGPKKAAHLLRPLAQQVLQSITESLDDDEDNDDALMRRMAFLRCFLGSDPRFDSKTKTNTVSRLAKLSSDSTYHEVLLTSYMSYLMNQIVLADTGRPEDNPVNSYAAIGYADLLFHLGKFLLRLQTGANPSFCSEMVTEIKAFAMAVAFFDCSPTLKNKRSLLHPALKAAQLVQVKRGRNGPAPYIVRIAMSSRFFSLVAESAAALLHSSTDEKEEVVNGMLSDVMECLQILLEGKATLLNHFESLSEEETPTMIVNHIKSQAHGFGEASDPASHERKKFLTCCSATASVLYIHLLRCGDAEKESDEEEDLDADDDEDKEDIIEFLIDLRRLVDLYVTDVQFHEDPLNALAALCVNILSSPLASGNQSRGASPRLLRDTVKMMWIAGLRFSSEKGQVLGQSTISTLLSSIGANSENDVGTDESSEATDTDADAEDLDDRSGSSSEAENLFTRAQLPEVADGNDTSDELTGQEHYAGENFGEIELNPDHLHAFLEEDSDKEIDEQELEHHAGADKALAKLIQIKQEARKAGQIARERSEISQQLRCTMLLETLVSGRPDGWGAVLRADHILGMIAPILVYRRYLEQSLSKLSGKGTGVAEKQALVDRLTHLLKAKICKVKFSSLPWEDNANVVSLCSDLSTELLANMQLKASREHQLCCNSALGAVIRATPGASQKLEVARVFESIVAEWASKRTTRLNASMLEDFINLNPVVAQAALSTSLAKSAVEARSPFLKSEAFRLLSLLFNTKLNSMSSEMDILASEKLKAEAGDVLVAFERALEDPDMKKSKRAREVLKSLESILNYLVKLDVPLNQVTSLKDSLRSLKECSESKPLSQTCEKVLKLIDMLAESSARTEKVNTTDEGDIADQAQSKIKSKKKKSKKKKR